MTTTDPTFAIYGLTKSSPQFFGRIVLIAAVGPGPGDLPPGRRQMFSDSYVLVERPSPLLVPRRVGAKPETFAEVGVTINREFMLTAAYEQCQVSVAELVEAKFQQAKNWALFATPFTFEPIEKTRLALLRGMGLWRPELERIEAQTECYELSQYLSMIALMNVTVQVPTES